METAGQLLVTAGDNRDRLRSEASFARLCGAAPRPVSSGRTDRHRLHRGGGERQANSALWRIALVRMGCHQPTEDCVARRTAEGKTKTEIMRCLKRYIAREVFPPPAHGHARCGLRLGLRSQNQLAEAVTRSAGQIGLRNVSITERTVRRWESDNPPWPQPDHQAALEHLFSRPVTELGFTPPWASEEAVPQQSERAASPGTGSSGGGAAGMFPMRVLADPLPGSIAADFITITSAYRHMYWTVPPAHLRDAVATHVRLGIMLVASVPEAARRPLAAAISESSLLAGRIEFFDMQNPQEAQQSLVVALQAAQDAYDSLLGAAVLAHMAFIPAFSGDSRRVEEARDKIRAARTFARRASAAPEMLAWLDAVEAEVETRFGGTRKALQLIRHAEEIYATEEPRPVPPWLDWFSPARLAGFKGNTLLIDRQPGPARETLQGVLDQLPEDSAKQRSVILGDLAAVAVSEGDPEEACRLSELALNQLARTWYATGMARARAVRGSLSQWESLPCVRRLDEKLYDWNTTINALSS